MDIPKSMAESNKPAPENSQNNNIETTSDPFGDMIPSTEKYFAWALISIKCCMVIFATFAFILDSQLL